MSESTPMDHREALERLNTLRNCVVETQEASWANVLYPLVAILNAAGFEQSPPTSAQVMAHKRAYNGRGGMPEPARECTCVGGSWCAIHGDIELVL